MAHARPEYAVTLAIVGVLLAIGIPAIRNGSHVLGGLCVLAATAIVGWAVRAILRERE